MHDIIHMATDILRNTVLITGLVVSMMMMIEVVNTGTKGKVFQRLRGNGFRQILLSGILGLIPGCMGGFAAVSLYTHRMISFGALIAMMVASSGDEAFVMLAMFPGKALILMAGLFLTGVISGYVIDKIGRQRHSDGVCDPGYAIHHADNTSEEHSSRTIGWKRILMFAGLLLFATALVTGMLAHSHGTEGCCHEHGHINLLNEDWMNVIFGILCFVMLYIIATSNDHMVNDHLWNHIIKKHLLTVFLWTLGVLVAVNVGLQYFNLGEWTGNNIALLILIATLVGIIPESGPHLIFVTLFATGNIPLSVLAASSISQDGHSSIPLLAEDKRGFLKAKAINIVIALIVGYSLYGLGL